MSWKRSCQVDAETVIQAVRRVVGIHRRNGRKMPDAERMAASDLTITPRRVRSLFYGEFGRIVLASEELLIRTRAASVLRQDANRLRMLADAEETEAKMLLQGREPNACADGDEYDCTSGADVCNANWEHVA